jgi:putative ABC transport system ATP-binding protein
MIYGRVNQEARRKKVIEMLTLMQLTDKAHNLSNQLSGGQIQRVAIARALVMNPSVILADEPTGNLDTKTANEIMDFIKNLNKQGKTIVLITHEPDIAQYAGRLIKLVDGKIISDRKQ